MKFIKVNDISIFRKVALSLWGGGGDPSVYGFLEVDVTHLKLLSSPTSLVIKGLSEVMKNHKELNFVMRFGRLYHRKSINISVMVNIPEEGRHDLSFATLRDVDRMSVTEIEEQLSKNAGQIRRREDPHLGFALRLIHKLPHFFTKSFLRVFGFLVHDLNLDLSFARLPKDPFGSVIVTNVGSLGIKKALVPLVPLTRAGLLISIGQVCKEPIVVKDKIEIREIMHLGVTFDHRFFDGAQAAKMIRDFEAFLKPDKM
ncbi:2-oxo acid dehydrogenase subunit E2 [Bdellovibrio sp. KM01]|uniref:2-oxo acid dehydrogenase subunit E2 n=1 Tax=Bdellovibrio sp. KM01 TaxID=2748865 RepID=UPI0015E8FA2A|nr:2-oxo acid dehydrogenase subunit E2 [Bdellovibrio sp. KM01]QLY24696.1 2-oxo acid dehydrogenase subunit E2 [Bdellovibrio sp. KM01]